MIDLIKKAFEEDMPNGDLTTESLGIKEVRGQARLVAKQDLVLSGQEIFEKSIKYIAPDTKIDWQFEDGNGIYKNQVVALLTGNLIEILKAERVALNFIGHLSGIATLTKKYVNCVQHTQTQILDTRKTTAGFRVLEKKAVVDGGGKNHRINLSQSILIKDNHINAVGGIEIAISRVQISSKHSDRPIEVEVQNLDEVKIAVQKNANCILLDNMDNKTMQDALELIPKEIQTEASGNMNLERVKEVAELGVTYISVGALTHSPPAADFSLKFDWRSA